MTSKRTNKIHKEFLQKAEKLARTNYKKLEKPKTCNQKDYVNNYIKEEIIADKIYKTFPKKNISDPTNTNPLAIVINEYLKILPLDERSSYSYLWKNIHKILKRDGEKFVKKEYLPILKRAEKPYIEILKARNKLAKKQGHSSFIESISIERYKIPVKDLQFFLKNKNKVIDIYQKQIPKVEIPDWFYSQFNKYPCFLCQLPNSPKINFPNEVINFVAKEYPILKKFQHKVKINVSQETYTEYLKKTDSFKISIDKELNNRHKITGLIHELSHVISILTNFKILSKNKYQHELETSKIELKLLKRLDPKLYQEKIASMLVTLYLVEFEVESIKNPDQDLPRLYAKTINKYFPQSKQIKNYAYLINENFVTHPLRNLPHAMAYIKILEK